MSLAEAHDGEMCTILPKRVEIFFPHWAKILRNRVRVVLKAECLVMLPRLAQCTGARPWSRQSLMKSINSTVFSSAVYPVLAKLLLVLQQLKKWSPTGQMYDGVRRMNFQILKHYAAPCQSPVNFPAMQMHWRSIWLSNTKTKFWSSMMYT